MRNLRGDEKIFVLTSAAVLLITLVSARSIFQNQRERIQTLRTKIAEEQEKNEILSKIETQEGKIGYYGLRLPRERNVEWLRKEVTELAKQAQIKIVSVEPQAPRDKGIYIQLPVKMVLDCSYHQLGSFISKLESSKEFIKLDSLRFKIAEKSEKEEVKPLARAELMVSSFYLKD